MNNITPWWVLTICEFNFDPYPGVPGDGQDWFECTICGKSFRKGPGAVARARQDCGKIK